MRKTETARPFSARDDDRLLALHAEGVSFAAIAARLKRSPAQIQGRFRALKKPAAEPQAEARFLPPKAARAYVPAFCERARTRLRNLLAVPGTDPRDAQAMVQRETGVWVNLSRVNIAPIDAAIGDAAE